MNKGSEAVVETLPECDFGSEHGPAVVDAKTTRGPWAYMCQPCWSVWGVRDRAGELALGLGRGQRLVARKAFDQPGWRR